MARSGNPNPKNQFTPDNNPSSKPRKRTALSEEILRDYIYTDGRKSLDEIRVLCKHEKPEIQLGALSLFTKLIFITSSNEEEAKENQHFIIFAHQLLQAVAEANAQGKNIDSNAMNALIEIISTLAFKQRDNLTQS